eukprot:CAMPEP_0181318774 /NCGR_PEP_ID=MMETSP1101-20121128/17192_1 /TAXON_ID=46948 /ORGANISM="Rhodomonas abbreviata, Strain Caron Lab Isolate" /LENGTH=380 /DNA_ID=CAMNT_0023426279 /DNA_START=13 /DNA_END=1155 /DNA_ORIENTATION=-
MRSVAIVVAFAGLAAVSALHAPTVSRVAPSMAPQQQGAASALRRVAVESAPMSLRGGEDDAPAESSPVFWNETVELAVLFGLWYAGNTGYNIYNKKALNNLGGAKGGLVWTIALCQLFTGVLWVLPLWLLGIRTKPSMTTENWMQIAPVGIFAAGAHGGSVVALGAGAVSFGQILKACEPAFSAVNEIIFLREVQAWQVYLTLIPIIGGVAIASLKELSFSWLAVWAAMIANQSAAMKAVFGKSVMATDWAKALGPANQYGVVNIISVLATLPVVLGLEAKGMKKSYDSALKKGVMPKDIQLNVLLSGFFFYLYNEVSFMALAKVSPVTHSVANTLKRVVIIVASCIYFGTPMTKEGMAGSAVAIAGTLLYSLAKQAYKK